MSFFESFFDADPSFTVSMCAALTRRLLVVNPGGIQMHISNLIVLGDGSVSPTHVLCHAPSYHIHYDT